ncbi:type III pantothenate kinase [Candidatus Puniceispirillum marinum]|uniref:Type III pantothenate kinase n=1 Tax=Puniceispirillum marinum (strain IMCC1322) TaxID=488538 RepID=D5BPB7_PUNMI|nr:type III pantothenate kinase [Candidatus Puniceispirillum marinum]ADE38399.1 Putative transcriptional regulator [Candidatus Puniceispirillum marinum IMCC1322]
MLLAVDCGNTNIVFAVYDNTADVSRQLGCWRIATDVSRSGDDYTVWLGQMMSAANLANDMVSGIVVASVVPEITPHLVMMARTGFSLDPMLIGDAGVDLGITVDIDNPSQAGADRLVNAVAAKHYHQVPAIILDFGTATTLDLVRADGAYAGGIIAPGVHVSVDALYKAAARLPRLDVKPWDHTLPVLGRDTTSAMESGIFWGYVGMIEGLITRLRTEQGVELPAIATGGLASLFAPHLPMISAVDADLTLRGLVAIYNLNNESNSAITAHSNKVDC